RAADSAIARQQVGRFGTGHVAEAFVQGRHADAADAVLDWDFIATFEKMHYRQEILVRRSLCLAHSGQTARATEEAEARLKTEHASRATSYNAACVYALASVSASNDANQADRFASRALELLGQAVRMGWNDAEHMKKDDDLRVLRQREGFKKLVTELEA